MFIRQVKKFNRDKSKTYYQYTLVQAQRVAGKVVQKNILYLGSDPLLKDKKNRQIVADELTALIFGQRKLFDQPLPKPLEELIKRLYDKFRTKYPEGISADLSIPPKENEADYQQVDIKGVEYEEVKEFGAENLGTQIIQRLKLEDFLIKNGFSKSKAILAQIAIIARAIYAQSEYKTAKILQDNSALPEIWKVQEPITYSNCMPLPICFMKRRMR